MSSLVGRVGNAGAMPVFSFTAAGQDSGVFGVQPAPYPNIPPLRLWPVGWEKFAFQLTGPGTGLQITILGTFDYQTSIGNGNAWFPIPGAAGDASSAQWSNPMLNTPGANALTVKAPLLAIKAQSSLAPGGTVSGVTQLVMLATS